MKNVGKTIFGALFGLVGLVVAVVLLRFAADVLMFLSDVDKAIMAKIGWFYIAYIIALVAAIGTLAYLTATRYHLWARILCIVGLVLTGPFLIGAFWHCVGWVGGGIG